MAGGKFERWRSEEGLLLVAGWAQEGLSEEQIAKCMGISRSTLSEWKKRFPDIADNLKKSKQLADVKVENALFKRAVGYAYDEITYERKRDPTTGEYKKIEVKRVTKEVQPDVAAQIFWLKNRRPERWKDRIQADISTEETKTGALDDIRAEMERLKAAESG